MSDADDLLINVHGSAAVVTLNRTRALNALTRAMRDSLAEALPRFARDPQIYAVVIRSASERSFSAGSDVREFSGLGANDRAEARRAFAEEYRLNWLMECFSKPTISLINGMVMGGGVGISGFGTHRVAGANYSWAMPETAIGLFPDVGVAFHLSRMGAVGHYLALSGRAVGRADAFKLGLATHCIDAEHFDAIETALAGAYPVDPVLDGLHRDPGPGALAAHMALIEQTFTASSVEEILDRLGKIEGPHRDWARALVSELEGKSPTSLKITHRQMREARMLDIRHVLMMDYRMMCKCLEDKDFYEGVRAKLIDKDGAPRWSPATLAEVTPGHVNAFFQTPENAEAFVLPSREDMQAARV